jgi:hypothetical protein
MDKGLLCNVFGHVEVTQSDFGVADGHLAEALHKDPIGFEVPLWACVTKSTNSTNRFLLSLTKSQDAQQRIAPGRYKGR